MAALQHPEVIRHRWMRKSIKREVRRERERERKKM